jgi:WD40 repeat protein
MSISAVTKVESHSTQSTPPENVPLPDEVLPIVFSHLSRLKDAHSLLLTNWQFNRCVSNDNLLWKGFVRSRFPYSFQEYENAPNVKDVLHSLKNRDWNINDYKFRTCTLNGHTKKVTRIDVQADKFASASLDGTVIMWDRNTRKILFKLDLSDHGPCNTLLIEGDTLFCGSEDGTITTWNANIGKKEHSWKGHVAGVLFLAVQGDKLISVGNEDTLKVWDLKENRGLVDSVEVMGFFHSLAVHGNKFFIGLEKMIQTGDLDNMKNPGFLGVVNGHEGGVYGLASQGDRLFSSTGYGAIKEWIISKMRLVRQIQVKPNGVLVPREEPSALIVKDNKIFYALDEIAVLDLKSGMTLYMLKREQPTTSACMQDGILISGSRDGTITLRDFNFPSLTSYDPHTLEKNLALLDKIAAEDDSLCNELHPNFLKRLQELKGKSLSLSEVILRLKIEVSLHLLLDRIHRGDQKKISELLDQPYWNELLLIEGQTTPLYKNVKELCSAQETKNLGKDGQKERALDSLKKKEQAVLKFLQHQKKY